MAGQSCDISYILADGILEKDEISFIKKLFTVFLEEEPRETLTKISALLREKKIPELEKLEVNDIDHLLYIMNILSAAVFANGKKLRQERDKYFEAGLKIGLNVGTLSYRLSLEAEKNRVKRKLIKINEELRKEFKQKKGT